MNSIAAGIAISNIPPKISKAASFLLNGSKSENETKTGNETKQENEKSMKPGNMGQQQVNLEKQNNKGKQMRFSNEGLILCKHIFDALKVKMYLIIKIVQL